MAREPIVVSARVGFAAVDQIADCMRNIDFPIELALPSRYDFYRNAVLHWKQMIDDLEKANITVNTVHATQGKINDDAFLEWGRETIKLAEHFSAKAITVHPNRVTYKSRGNMQELARINLRRLRHQTSVLISVETFTGRDRVFRPKEIMEAKLPMTLDTAHIHDKDRIMKILELYWKNIPVVHLSARGKGEQHLPVDQFCIQVVRRLIELGWSGSIALEYLPPYHHLLRPDIKIVESALIQDINVEEIRSIAIFRNSKKLNTHRKRPWLSGFALTHRVIYIV